MINEFEDLHSDSASYHYYILFFDRNAIPYMAKARDVAGNREWRVFQLMSCNSDYPGTWV